MATQQLCRVSGPLNSCTDQQPAHLWQGHKRRAGAANRLGGSERVCDALHGQAVRA